MSLLAGRIGVLVVGAGFAEPEVEVADQVGPKRIVAHRQATPLQGYTGAAVHVLKQLLLEVSVPLVVPQGVLCTLH